MQISKQITKYNSYFVKLCFRCDYIYRDFLFVPLIPLKGLLVPFKGLLVPEAVPELLSPNGGCMVRVRVIRERLRATPGHVIGQGPAPGGRDVPRGGGSGGK